jgi:hypothetical protein
MEPLSPERKWRAITFSTLLLAPAMWAILGGVVALAADDGPDGLAPAAAVAFGLSMLPFVYILLAFASQHPQAPGAVIRAMGLCLLVGIPASAIAADAVTGLVAGVGAGGIVALRADLAHDRRWRAVGVAIGAVYAFVLARTAGPVVLVAAPVFPFTALGLADHYAEWRLARARAVRETSPHPGG